MSSIIYSVTILAFRQSFVISIHRYARASHHDDYCQITSWIFVPNKKNTWYDCLHGDFFFLPQPNRTLFSFNPITKKKWAKSKRKKQLKTFPLMHFDDKSMCIYMINAIVFPTLARMKEISTLITIYRQIFVSFVKLFMHVISNWLLSLSHLEQCACCWCYYCWCSTDAK